MPLWTAWTPKDSIEPGKPHRPSLLKKGKGQPGNPHKYIAHEFHTPEQPPHVKENRNIDSDAADKAAAESIFDGFKRDGIPVLQEPLRKVVAEASPAPPPKLWHFWGTPHYLAPQHVRMGIADGEMLKVKQDADLHRISTILSQLCLRYHRCRKENDIPVLDYHDKAAMKSTLDVLETAVAQMHGIAACSSAMVDEARRWLGFEPIDRCFSLTSTHDSPQPACEAKAS